MMLTIIVKQCRIMEIDIPLIPFYLFIFYLDKSYRSLIALILPVIFTYFVISLRSCFYSKRLRHWMAFYVFMCWCSVMKLFTHLVWS